MPDLLFVTAMSLFRSAQSGSEIDGGIVSG
jgi:hypothetical protein